MCTIFACKKRVAAPENPFFTQWHTPLGIPPFDLIRTEHYRPAFDSAMKSHLAQIDSIKTNPAPPDFANTILAFDRSGEMLDRVSDVFFSLTMADTNPAMQALEEEISPKLAAHSDTIMMDSLLFARIKTVYTQTLTEQPRDSLKSSLDSLQRRLTEKTYRDFVRAGAALSPADRNRLRAINKELSTLTVRFGNNVLAATNAFHLELDSAGVADLPYEIQHAARQRGKDAGKDGTYLFDLSAPSRTALLTYSGNADLRRKVYEAYTGLCDGGQWDNKQIINDIIRLRTERAHLLGFPSHAAWVLDEQMARTPQAVYALLDDLWPHAKDRANKELEQMKPLKDSTGNFDPWDWWYYAEKVRKANYALSDEALRPYFSLENVKLGIFELCNRLYGITFRPVPAKAYNDECQIYQILDRDNSHLGVIIMDFFPRPGKKAGAWCGDFVRMRYQNGKRVAPVTTIVCNFTRPLSADDPALLSLEETETFFHEFGHALHALFNTAPYNGLRDVERDFVEFPSQLMECWATAPEALRLYAVDYRTGAAMPQYLIDKITRSSLFNQGFATVEYLAASYSDMDIHTIDDFKPFDVAQFERMALNVKRGLPEQIAPRYHYPYFNHIFSWDYSAGYYSYIWAEVLVQDAFDYFRQSGDIFNSKIAASLRANILSAGGTADGMALYERFRGAPPSREPLLRHRGLVPDSTQQAPVVAPH